MDGQGTTLRCWVYYEGSSTSELFLRRLMINIFVCNGIASKNVGDALNRFCVFAFFANILMAVQKTFAVILSKQCTTCFLIMVKLLIFRNNLPNRPGCLNTFA